jgi:hypothetical protein
VTCLETRDLVASRLSMNRVAKNRDTSAKSELLSVTVCVAPGQHQCTTEKEKWEVGESKSANRGTGAKMLENRRK